MYSALLCNMYTVINYERLAVQIIGLLATSYLHLILKTSFKNLSFNLQVKIPAKLRKYYRIMRVLLSSSMIRRSLDRNVLHLSLQVTTSIPTGHNIYPYRSQHLSLQVTTSIPTGHNIYPYRLQHLSLQVITSIPTGHNIYPYRSQHLSLQVTTSIHTGHNIYPYRSQHLSLQVITSIPTGHNIYPYRS